MQAPAVLHVVVASDQTPVHLGEEQCAWLVEHGHASYRGQHGEDTHLYDSDMTSTDLDALVMSTTEIRSCDFCQRMGAPWGMRVRPFHLVLGERPGIFKRDAAICDRCEPLVRRNDRPALIEIGVEGAKEKAVRMGGYMAAVIKTNSNYRIRQQLLPLIKEFTTAILAHRDGPPFQL